MNSKADELLNAHKFVDGHLVSAKVERIVRAIKEYEPELEVRWIPPTERKEGDSAYAILHDSPQNSGPYVLFYVKNDEDFDERVLYRIIANDQRHTSKTLSEYEAWEQTQMRIKQQEFLDKLEEAHDIAQFALKTHLNKFTVPDMKNPGQVLTFRE